MRDFEDAISAAKVLHLDDEELTAAAASLAGTMCERPCVACDGELHHWLEECADEGDPIEVCKHCSAWRPYQGDAPVTPDKGADR